MALTTLPTAALADGAVTTEKLVADVNFRNIIINGDMSIAQRSTSVASISSVGYYTIDRFKLTDASSGTWTQSQSTDVPTGQGFATSLKMDCTTADASPGSGDSLVLQQLIEGQNLQYLKKGTSSAESTTLSFWVKSNKTGTYICELRDIDNNRTISQSYTISSANTWEKKTITFAGDTVEAFLNDNTAGLNLAFSLGSGTDYTTTDATSWGSFSSGKLAYGQVANIASSTANNFYITGVQLEAGTTASDFEFLPVDVNLNRCHRYCNAFMDYGAGNVSGNRCYSSGYGASGGFVRMSIPRMRTQPTLTYVASGGTIDTDYGAPDIIQLLDNDDNTFYIYDVIAEAEL